MAGREVRACRPRSACSGDAASGVSLTLTPTPAVPARARPGVVRFGGTGLSGRSRASWMDQLPCRLLSGYAMESLVLTMRLTSHKL